MGGVPLRVVVCDGGGTVSALKVMPGPAVVVC